MSVKEKFQLAYIIERFLIATQNYFIEAHMEEYLHDITQNIYQQKKVMTTKIIDETMGSFNVQLIHQMSDRFLNINSYQLNTAPILRK